MRIRLSAHLQPRTTPNLSITGSFVDPRKIQIKMEHSSSGDRRNRSSQNRQGQRSGRRRQNNRSGNRNDGGSNRRSSGKREYRPSNRGHQVAKKPSFGQRLVSILSLGLLGGKSKPAPSGQSKSGNRKDGKNRQVRDNQSRDDKRTSQKIEVTSARLYVGNLDYKTTDSDLEQHFSNIGDVKSAEVVINRRTQKSKGFAFVEMGSTDEARKAVDTYHNEDFMGRRMLVSGAKSPGASGGNEDRSDNGSGRQNRRTDSRPSNNNRNQRSERKEDRRSNDNKERQRPPKVEEPVEITSSRLRLNNLGYEVDETELEELFKGIGVVVSTEVAHNPDTHQSMGYGFVEMSHIDEARRAVEILNNKDYMGRRLAICDAQEDESPAAEENPETDQNETTPSIES